MAKRRRATVTSLLVGDDLAHLLEDISFNEGDRLLLVAITDEGVKVSTSSGLSLVEAIGGLSVAIKILEKDFTCG